MRLMVITRALPWDTQHFGMQICRVEAEPKDNSEDISAALAKSTFVFASARTPVGDVNRTNLLLNAGFRIADVRTYLSVKLDRLEPPALVSGTTITDFVEDHRESLKKIARTSFWSDHFHNDDRFERAKVDAMYELWVDKCVSEGYTILVAVSNGTPVGFLAGKRSGDAFYIELVAVSEGSRGHGVGRDLVVRAMTKATPTFKEASVAVQLSNVEAVRIYERLGFRTAKSEFTFHWWRK